MFGYTVAYLEVRNRVSRRRVEHSAWNSNLQETIFLHLASP